MPRKATKGTAGAATPPAVETTTKAESSAAEATASARPFVQLFSDGACKGNPGPGGWGFLLRHPASGQEKRGSGGVADTTNNQMELQAVISGLRALTRPSVVEVVTDSAYVVNGCSQWLPGWKRNGWRRKEGASWKPVKNVEYWQALDELLAKHEVQFRWIKGHAGHAENELCDELACEEAEKFRRS